jgi:branched-chain amino acid transport system substrate-binding protein
VTNPATSEVATDYRDGIELALARANAAGGVRGHWVRLQVEDDNFDPARALPLATHLVQDEGAVALVGCIGTGSLAQLERSHFLEVHQIADFAHLTGSRAEMSADLVFPIRGSYEDEVDAMLAHAATLGRHRIGFLYWRVGAGPQLAAEVLAMAKAHGLDLVASEGFDVPKDPAAQAASARRAVRTPHEPAPDAIVLIAAGQPLAAAVHEIRVAYGASMPIYCLGQVSLKSFVRAVGAQDARNVSLSQVMPGLGRSQLPISHEFLTDRSHLHPSLPDSYAALEGYVAGRVLLQVLGRAADFGSAAIARAARESGVMDVGGFRVSYGASGKNKALQPIDMTIVGRDGELVR